MATFSQAQRAPDLLCVDVVEEAVDGEVSPQGVLLRSPDAYLRNARVCVRVAAQVDEVQLQVDHLHARRLQVLGLVRVALDDCNLRVATCFSRRAETEPAKARNALPC